MELDIREISDLYSKTMCYFLSQVHESYNLPKELIEEFISNEIFESEDLMKALD